MTPRELRTVAERVLLRLGLPRGCLPSGALAIEAAEMLAGMGISYLRERLETGLAADPAKVALVHDDPAFAVVDAGGQTVLLAGPPALDLASAKARSCGAAVVSLLNLEGAPLLDAMSRARPDLLFRVLAGRLVLCVNERPPTEPTFRGGLEVDERAWADLVRYANTVLAPPSERSRLDAGL